MQIFSHALHNGITLRVDSRVIQWIIGIGNTQETCGLLVGLRSHFRHFQ